MNKVTIGSGPPGGASGYGLLLTYVVFMPYQHGGPKIVFPVFAFAFVRTRMRCMAYVTLQDGQKWPNFYTPKLRQILTDFQTYFTD